MRRWQENLPWTASAIKVFWPAGPARRKRWLVIAISALAVVALHALVTALAAARTARTADRFVARWGALEPAAARPAPVEDSENGARAVRAATDIMNLPSVRPGGPARIWESFASVPEATFTSADRDVIRRAVSENARSLSLLDVAAERSGANWELHYEWGVEVDVPPLMPILRLSKLNAAAGRLALEEGRFDDAISALRRGYAISSSLRNEPILIVQLVRLAVDRLDAALARRILASGDLRLDRLAALEAACPALDPRRDLQRAMVVEAKAMSRTFRDGIGADKVLWRRSSTESLLTSSLTRALARPFLLREERLWLETMAARIDALGRPRGERATIAAEPGLRSWDVLVRAGLGAMGSIPDRCDLAESRERIFRAAIAIERRRLESGRAPAALPNPAPVDPLTGRPFGYEFDGASWRIRSVADLSSMESARMNDPILDWSRRD